MGYKNIEDKRAYHRQYMRERREFFRQHHLCTECGKEDAYTMNGHPRCFEHTHYRHKSPMEYIKPEKEPSYPKRRQDGYCHICGNPYMDGLTKWGGNPIKLCERCYNNLVRAGERGRASFAEKHEITWGQMQYEISQRLRELRSSGKSSPRNG